MIETQIGMHSIITSGTNLFRIAVPLGHSFSAVKSFAALCLCVKKITQNQFLYCRQC